MVQRNLSRTRTWAHVDAVHINSATDRRICSDFHATMHLQASQGASLCTSSQVKLVDGYAPFCKHLFIPNFTPARGSCLDISPENEHLLRSGYDARTEQELPVLVRWFPAESVPEPPVAKYGPSKRPATRAIGTSSLPQALHFALCARSAVGCYWPAHFRT
jgi:hypothetical protein